MPRICLHDKDPIEAFLRRNSFLHLYELGDLDDYFWGQTTWYALERDGCIEELALLYSGLSEPTLLALTEGSGDSMGALLQELQLLLPRRFYAHLSPGLPAMLAQRYAAHSHGLHIKMALTNPAALPVNGISSVIPLTQAHLGELEDLYNQSYPGNWFDSRMLATGFYFGLRRDDALVSAAGVHVYSRRYRVASLGNVTTRPDWRGQGFAQMVCARLCRELLSTVDQIGLNVKADNRSAIACYERLGFTRAAEFEECSFEAR